MRIAGCALVAGALVVVAAYGAEVSRPGAAAVPGHPGPHFAAYKLQCAGYGPDEVIFTNFGQGPVPAGTFVTWKTGATSTEPKARSGTFMFEKDLPPQASAGINWPPPPSPGSNQGGVPQIFAPLALEFLEPCTFTAQPGSGTVHMPMPLQPH
jgi:hypothetical protein